MTSKEGLEDIGFAQQAALSLAPADAFRIATGCQIPFHSQKVAQRALKSSTTTESDPGV
jgi:hypothetical protein